MIVPKQPAPHIRAFLLGLLAGGLALGWCLLPHAPTRSIMPLFDGSDYLSSGENLLHQIPVVGDVSHRMPLATLLSALLLNHSAVPWHVLRTLLLLGTALLAAAVCVLLEGSAAAALAAAALVCRLLLHEPPPFFELTYSLLLLVVAGTLVWRAERPTAARSLALAAAFGVSFLFRSTLFLFPPILAACEFLAALKARAKWAWRQALIIVVVPYLFLLPWIGLNWRLHHHFIPFEHAAPDLNIVLGVLGLVNTSGGDPAAIVPDLGSMGTQNSVMPWALREIGRHPWRYIAAYVQRLFYFFRLHPLVISLAALSLGLNRRSGAFLSMGLLAAYFAGINCTMSITSRYFAPLWPILALLACAALSAAYRRSKPRSLDPGSRLRGISTRILIACLAFLLVFAAYSARTVGSYAALAAARSEPPSAADYDRAIGRYPEDPKLRLARGLSRRRGGDLAGAEEDLAKAASLQPGNHEFSLELAFVRAVRGDASSLWSWQTPWTNADPNARRLKLQWRVYQAISCAQRGENPQALDYLRKALTLTQYFIVPLVYESPSAARVETQVRHFDGEFIGGLLNLSSERPSRERLALIRAACALLPQSGRARLEEAVLAAENGQRREALKALQAAQELGLDAEMMERVEALRKSLSLREFGIAPHFMDLAERAIKAGERTAALGYLEQAARQRPGLETGRRIAALFVSLGEKRRALAVLEGLTARWPAGASVWMDLAELAAGSAEGEAAVRSLERIGSGAMDDTQKRRLAMIYQDAGRLDKAMGLLTDLVKSQPNHVLALHDRGVCLYLQGKREAAIHDLRQALALDPDFPPAKRTLDAILNAPAGPAHQ